MTRRRAVEVVVARRHRRTGARSRAGVYRHTPPDGEAMRAVLQAYRKCIADRDATLAALAALGVDDKAAAKLIVAFAPPPACGGEAPP